MAGDGPLDWFSDLERERARRLFEAHTGRPDSYCLLCGNAGPCVSWQRARDVLAAAGDLGDDGNLRPG